VSELGNLTCGVLMFRFRSTKTIVSNSRHDAGCRWQSLENTLQQATVILVRSDTLAAVLMKIQATWDGYTIQVFHRSQLPPSSCWCNGATTRLCTSIKLHGVTRLNCILKVSGSNLGKVTHNSDVFQISNSPLRQMTGLRPKMYRDRFLPHCIPFLFSNCSTLRNLSYWLST